MIAAVLMLTVGIGGFASDATASYAPKDEELIRSVPPIDSTRPVADPIEPRPPITANEFFPEERNVTSCIGVLERPGCGSKGRGGWRQTAILGAILVGMAVIFGNIARGVSASRRRQADVATPTPTPTPAADTDSTADADE